MTTKKIYGPWIKWHGGECPVMRDQEVMVKLRSGVVRGPSRAVAFLWVQHGSRHDIMEYCTVTEQPELEAAEKLLRANGYTVTPPVKPLTFEDVQPMTEAPLKGARYWVISAAERDGVYSTNSYGSVLDHRIIRRRMAYLDKEHALIAARHIFGLKGGEL